MFTRPMLMANILVVIGEIYRYQFKCTYLENKRLLRRFYCFFESIKNFEHSEKNDPHSSSLSDIIYFETCGYLNA